MTTMKLVLFENRELLARAVGAVGLSGVASLEELELWLQVAASAGALILSVMTIIKLIHQFFIYRKRRKYNEMDNSK